MSPLENPQPLRARHRKPSAPHVSRRTRAIRGDTGLSPQLEERANFLLKQLASDLHGDDWSCITDAERKALSRKVAVVMRREGANGVSAGQVRLVAQRMRCKPEVRTGYPVDLDPEAYAFIAHEAEVAGLSKKAMATVIIREYRERMA